jgi:hypothetical protein
MGCITNKTLAIKKASCPCLKREPWEEERDLVVTPGRACLRKAKRDGVSCKAHFMIEHPM